MIHIKSDSRQIKPGDTFIALRGVSSDGHDYIEKAIELGATKIIAEKGEYSVLTEIVPDTRAYLENYLAETYSDVLKNINIIGTTGTNGKTTICFLLYQALNLTGSKTAYAGTVGFYLEEKVKDLPNTTPDIIDVYDMIITAYESGCENMVLEVSSQGISYQRVAGIKFDYAIFSNLTKDHLDYHKTMENYALAKQELFKQLKTNGIAIVNIDDQYSDYYLLEQNKNITYGFTKSDYQVVNYNPKSMETEFKYQHKDETQLVKSKLIGQYNVYNLLAAIAVLKEMGITDEKIEQIIPKLNSPSGRMDNIRYKINNIIIDYAHTPDAIINIIKTVKDVSSGKLYAVFGCTGDRDRTKRPIMLDIVTTECNYAIITNDDPHFEDPNQIVADMVKGITKNNYEVIFDRKDAIIKGINLLNENDTLLILGKGHEEFMIVGKDKIPFNDRKVVMEYLGN
ncbi:MAG: UDP-N-acetylmuramoyl-L-alanyl-D-glutamate--2,6-diaminopimelate ligase [Bacilli bacterium]|nr:UDP-N-acetylmuramoyl-L-alanyl-D-glutamate--2,6-diaminopimelate ligase [Bacilli bacterium]MDD4282959.1 UDP-N-acetylmuramoyl-L-alanyl-D-glutamate--2,6-diaminopimelate ligase [Bacilli bacterium]MDD4718432.1 UDP-N-acetylmuramoyl-L-alanyl-D-glutamate--2,6-diaminopimelate ligase [Bacilli bacterium]